LVPAIAGKPSPKPAQTGDVDTIAYYRARADRYDDEAYGSRSSDWWAEMALVVERFDAIALGTQAVELASGTGFWTERLVQRGMDVTAIDAAPEMLRHLDARVGGQVRTVEADLLTWKPHRQWDACVACFWVCHVPEDHLVPMASAMAAAVRPGGALFVADKAAPGRPDRRVAGHRYRITDDLRSPEALAATFEEVGFTVTTTLTGRRFVVLEGVRRAAELSGTWAPSLR
jgi:SAM-dependent methyltransferase